MMNLVRAKKKLRYLQSEESTPGQLKIKDVFSMQDLDNIFDDLDSDPGTPLLSPLPKSPRLDEQKKGSQSPVLKSPLPFKVETSPLKGSDVLAAEADIQTDHLNDKGSPFEEIAPIKTSSPIELLAVEGFAEDAELPETSPLLFGIEDEEPVVGDLSKPQMNERSESPKGVPEGDSESLVSPPARLEFGKIPKQNVPVTSSTPRKAPEAPDQVCNTSAPEPEEESQTDGRLTLFPVVLIQKHLPEQLLEEQPNKQVQEVAVEVAVKQSLFQKKLKDSLQPKASCFRKQETTKQPVCAPSPHVQEEDFMILEDDSPIRFTIPRKTEIKAKPASECGSAKPDSTEKASLKQTEEAENHKDEPKKKTKAKRGKASDMTTKDIAVQSAPEERDDKDVGDGEQICLSPDTNQDADIPVTDKQTPKGKTSKPDQHGSKDGNGGGKIPAEKPTAKTRKSAKLPTSTDAGQEEPASNVKKKPRKTKSAIKAGAPECKGLSSAKTKKPDEDRRTLMNKKRAKEQEYVDEVQNHTEPQPEVQSTRTVNKANKEPASTQRAPKTPLKVKKKEKAKEIFKVKELPVPDSADVFRENPATSRRKRKPPGQWWLAQHDENRTQEQQEAVQSSQELQSNRKTQRKAPVLTDTTEEEFVTTSRETRNDPIPVQKPKKVKKSQTDKSESNPAGSLKNPKSAGGRRKPKPGARDPCEMTPALRVEEEARHNEASGQLSPEVACSRLPRQCSLTPGDKRVFDKSYTREDRSGSAQKHPPRLTDALESLPVKRQRKTPWNWWEVPQSQGPVESSRSPRNSSPQTSRPQMDPSQSAFRKKASLKKTVYRSRKSTKMNNMINTPKSVRKSLASFDALYDSGKLGPSTERGQGPRQKGRRNLLHSLEEQSEQSSENIHIDYQQQQHATFDVRASGDVPESSAARRKSNPRASSGSNRASADFDIAFKSGPSSLIELERYEEDEDVDMPTSRVIPQTRFTPRVLSECDLCGPPLKPIVLDNEDWDNLCVWFTHIWPVTSKDGKGVNPGDFHWHCHAGRAMGHMVDLQNNTFSSGKILLGSYMKKPVQTDLNAITVFNVASSCVRVETDSAKEVYNSGQTFMTSCGQSYSIHNLCQEPAVLWYHRMLPNHTPN